jgi:hypothetical protein
MPRSPSASGLMEPLGGSPAAQPPAASAADAPAAVAASALLAAGPGSPRDSLRLRTSMVRRSPPWGTPGVQPCMHAAAARCRCGMRARACGPPCTVQHPARPCEHLLSALWSRRVLRTLSYVRCALVPCAPARLRQAEDPPETPTSRSPSSNLLAGPGATASPRAGSGAAPFSSLGPGGVSYVPPRSGPLGEAAAKLLSPNTPVIAAAQAAPLPVNPVVARALSLSVDSGAAAAGAAALGRSESAGVLGVTGVTGGAGGLTAGRRPPQLLLGGDGPLEPGPATAPAGLSGGGAGSTALAVTAAVLASAGPRAEGAAWALPPGLTAASAQVNRRAQPLASSPWEGPALACRPAPRCARRRAWPVWACRRNIRPGLYLALPAPRRPCCRPRSPRERLPCRPPLSASLQ